MPTTRDNAMTALILGFFAASWFGWALERPPAAWRTPLIAGAVLSLGVAAIGAVFAWRAWSRDSVVGEPGSMRQYSIIVGAEFGIAALGAAALVLQRQSAYLSPWISLVVGLHFWPLAPVLKNPALLLLGRGRSRVRTDRPCRRRRRGGDQLLRIEVREIRLGRVDVHRNRPSTAHRIALTPQFIQPAFAQCRQMVGTQDAQARFLARRRLEDQANGVVVRFGPGTHQGRC